MDATRVYWTEMYSARSVRSCPIAGCTGGPTTLALGQLYPRSLAVDSAHAYWFTGEAYEGPGQLVERALAGCGSTPTVLAAEQPTPSSLALDQSFVCWTNKREAKQNPARACTTMDRFIGCP